MEAAQDRGGRAGTPGLTLSPVPSPGRLDAFQLAARKMRENLKDKSYRAYPLGQEAGAYLRWKRGQIAATTYRTEESCLDKLVRHFVDLEIKDFEPPVGTERLEEFLDIQWGDKAPGTYNTMHAILRSFFKWAVLKGKLHGDPTLAIPRRKRRDVYRETFSGSVSERIMVDGPSEETPARDRLALHLLLKYGIRKGALRTLQFGRCDAARKKVTLFTKGGKVQTVPVPDDWWWDELSILQLELNAHPDHYLVCRQKAWDGFVGYDRKTGAANKVRRFKQWHDQPMSEHGMHSWWYRCLSRAGIVAEGVERGEKMHKARHTAGQRLLDKHGNLKAVQKMLGHSKIATTGDVYVDWDDDQLAAMLREDS